MLTAAGEVIDRIHGDQVFIDNDASVREFLDAVENEQKRQDSYRLLSIMEEVTGEKGKMWGPSIVGFGSYHYVYPSGNSGDWMLAGFSPRKQALAIYMMAGNQKFEKDLKNLGKHKIGKSCLYVKKLDDIDEKILRRMISESIKAVKKRYS